MSEYPPQTPLRPHQLITRDRLQSALSMFTLVTQSSLNGGAMHTARFAYTYDKPLYVPYLASNLKFDKSQQGNRFLGCLSKSSLCTKSPQFFSLQSHIKLGDEVPFAQYIHDKKQWIQILNQS